MQADGSFFSFFSLVTGMFSEKKAATMVYKEHSALGKVAIYYVGTCRPSAQSVLNFRGCTSFRMLLH